MKKRNQEEKRVQEERYRFIEEQIVQIGIIREKNICCIC